MRTRILAGIAAIAVVPFLLTACGGGGSHSVLPSSPGATSTGPQTVGGGGHVHTMDITANDLHAGGGGAPMWVYNNDQQPIGLAANANQPLAAPGSLFGQAPTVGNILYCSTGSDFGVSVFDGANTAASTAACANLGAPATGFGGRMDPPDFAGSDIALSSTQYATYASSRKPAHGEPIEAPLVVGPIDVSYRTSDLSGLGSNRLQLSRWSYCAIANGTVTNWNDPAITADNGGVPVASSLPITVFYRGDADGFNLTLQRHLATVCRAHWAGPYDKAPYQGASRSAAWTGGKPAENWTGPATGNFVASNGADAQLQSIGHTAGSTGFTEGALAVQDFQLNAALLQDLDGYVQTAFNPAKNFFADPESTTNLTASTATMVPVPGGSDSGFVGSSQPQCIAYIPAISYADPIAPNAYPIVEVSYGLFYSTSNGHFADVQSLLEYIDTNSGSSPAAGTSDQVVESNGYVPLPSLVKSYLNNTITGGKKPCLQS